MILLGLNVPHISSHTFLLFLHRLGSSAGMSRPPKTLLIVQRQSPRTRHSNQLQSCVLFLLWLFQLLSSLVRTGRLLLAGTGRSRLLFSSTPAMRPRVRSSNEKSTAAYTSVLRTIFANPASTLVDSAPANVSLSATASTTHREKGGRST
ncbi:hypothetical protein BDV93DRAFT_80334 [Ceratobasidium sp. AG-I]|nr:hypothetical protein BDV93DRAFT_80334 [Ceratobasidium sp. AG-I]